MRSTTSSSWTVGHFRRPLEPIPPSRSWPTPGKSLPISPTAIRLTASSELKSQIHFSHNDSQNLDMPFWKKAYHGNCWGVLGGEPVGVTSVKDLFYRTFGDIPRAIREISQAGYQAIELFDGNLVEYEGKLGELRSRLDEAGLSLLAVYSGGNFVFPEILPEELW